MSLVSLCSLESCKDKNSVRSCVPTFDWQWARASHSNRSLVFCANRVLTATAAKNNLSQPGKVWYFCFSVVLWAVLWVFTAMHMPVTFSSFALCGGVFSTKQNHPVSFTCKIWLSPLYACVCVCLAGLVHRLEPNPQPTGEEKAVRRRHSDGHQSNGLGPAGAAQPEHQQVQPDVHRRDNTWHLLPR